MMWKANKGVIAKNFNELGLGTIRQKNEGPLYRKYLKFNCIQTLSFGTHKETYSLCLNVSTEKGAPNHPNLHMRMLLQKILMSHSAWKFSNNIIYIYIYI